MRREEHDDVQLIRRIAAHDRDAFELLYDRYTSRIIAFLNRYLGASERHEDIVNDVMIVVWQRAADFRSTSRPSSWLLGIARRKALTAYHRATKAHAKPISNWANRCAEEAPEDIALAAERLDDIRKALHKLPLDQRTPLILASYHNCSQQEIATRTGYPVSTIKSRMRQGLRRMKVALNDMHALESS
ncbi:RNA polymerase sigma factor [Candidatus Entotheonella palauensis]|uniref:RNA polymerase sigma factor n=1 Tax=Candidatus Entotheonella gemina TaxID=1429439 RepID=W4MBE7_9BACT|nr:RNA polymerase sigma factor [Candidatus Entotheonella palauensis]ETX07528.1 MAG: hypothetical protein ETSY2_10695 [Candidatus Entotheonella gemina]